MIIPTKDPYPKVLIIPSVLPADFSELGRECERLGEAGVDRIHWDVMDGKFVPNLTFGPDVIAACRRHSALPFEAHLMIERPEDSLSRYVDSGCEIITVHAESTKHLHRTLSAIRSLGAKPAVALNPSTPVSAIENVMDQLDMILVMTVNPGFGGQSYLSSMEPKIAAIRSMITSSGLAIDLEVDGGVSSQTVAGAASAGANVLVAGTSLFRHPDGLGAATDELRKLAQESMRIDG